MKLICIKTHIRSELFQGNIYVMKNIQYHFSTYKVYNCDMSFRLFTQNEVHLIFLCLQGERFIIVSHRFLMFYAK